MGIKNRKNQGISAKTLFDVNGALRRSRQKRNTRKGVVGRFVYSGL